MAQLDRRKFLQMVGLGSAVALLPRMPAAKDVAFEYDYDGDPQKGVFIDNFSEDDVNVVTLTIDFNDALADDHDARYALYYADEFDKDGNPILVAEGKVGGRHKIEVPVEANRQVGCRAMGLQHAQFVENTMFVTDKPSMYMVAALERNYVN